MSKNWHLRLVLWSRVTYKDCTFLVGVYLCIVLLLAQPPKHAAPHALGDRVWLRMGGLPLPCRWTRFGPPDENTHAMKAHQQRQHLAAALFLTSPAAYGYITIDTQRERSFHCLFCLYLCVSQFLKGTTLWCVPAAPLIEIKLKEYQTAKTAV